jgi:hypothetical protein
MAALSDPVFPRTLGLVLACMVKLSVSQTGHQAKAPLAARDDFLPETAAGAALGIKQCDGLHRLTVPVFTRRDTQREITSDELLECSVTLYAIQYRVLCTLVRTILLASSYFAPDSPELELGFAGQTTLDLRHRKSVSSRQTGPQASGTMDSIGRANDGTVVTRAICELARRMDGNNLVE